MKKIKFILSFVAYAFSLMPSAFSQDIHFSQFFETPLLRNPSLAGIYTGDIRVQAVYRNQWNNVTNAYKTESLNGEYKMPVGKGNDFMTVGLQMLNDVAGTIGWTSTYFLPALNFHKSLSADQNRYLSAGFMGGFVQRRFDRSKMTTNSQYNGFGDGETFSQASYIYLDGSAGMSYNSSFGSDVNNNFFAGVAYHHFNRPSNSFYRNAKIELNPKWVFSAGVKFVVTDYTFLTIQADHSNQGSFQETVAGTMFAIKIGEDINHPQYTIQGGAFLRWGDALIPVIKVDYNPFSFAFSYDANISALKPSSYGLGGFEFSLSYIAFRSRLEKSTINSILCPRF